MIERFSPTYFLSALFVMDVIECSRFDVSFFLSLALASCDLKEHFFTADIVFGFPVVLVIKYLEVVKSHSEGLE